MPYVFDDLSACCGCGLCQTVCPCQAITMMADDEGFRYPSIDENLCSHCNACQRVCVFQKGPEYKPMAYYAARHKEAAVLARSSSGGVFAAMAHAVLDRGGVVFGAVFTEDWQVVHAQANTANDITPMHGSKYIPSDMDGVYTAVEALLKVGSPVLFTGVPCQVGALRKWLDMRSVPREKFFCLDIVCHSVASPSIWQAYLDEFKKHYGQYPMEISFRSKALGWSARRVTLICGDGINVTDEWSKELDFFKLWSSQCINRPSCHSCPYANEKRMGDLTGGDFIGVEKLSYRYPKEEGVSVLSVNTEKGQEILKKLPLHLIPVTRKQCLQQALDYPAAAPKNRPAFWRTYTTEGFDKVVKKYGRMTLEKKLVYNIVVPICKKLGIYQFAAKLYLKKK